MTSFVARLFALSLLGLVVAGCGGDANPPVAADDPGSGAVYSGSEEEGTGAMAAPPAVVE
ncbi:hypothetical protein [Tautonia marina]|uniref:hypothetical protein n=1 Tax=Tautonia marina TaxID=2653855 RepID=UPI0012606B4E|nr:hypothetical protein [Tautonia marina]